MFTDNSFKKVLQLLKIFGKKDPRYQLKLRSWDDFKKIPICGRKELKRFIEKNSIEGGLNIGSTSRSTATRMLIAHSKQTYRAHKRRLVKLYRQFA